MSDYIKRDDAIKAIREIYDNAWDAVDADDMFRDGLLEARDAVMLVPSADVVEVVRCKDCKNWNKDTERNDGYGYCSYWQRFIAQAASEDIQTYKDVFCCYGERKDNE